MSLDNLHCPCFPSRMVYMACALVVVACIHTTSTTVMLGLVRSDHRFVETALASLKMLIYPLSTVYLYHL